MRQTSLVRRDLGEGRQGNPVAARVGVLWAMGALVAWGFAAARVEICTTAYRCTLTNCPSRCDRPESALKVGLAVMTITTVIVAIHPFFRRAWSTLVVLSASAGTLLAVALA